MNPDMPGPKELLEQLLADVGAMHPDEIRQQLVELLATVPLPEPMELEVTGDGGVAAKLVAAGDPDKQVQVSVSTCTGETVQASFTQMDARARLHAAAVIGVARQLVAGVFDDLLTELDHQEREYRVGRDPVHPDRRPVADEEFPAGADAHAATYKRGYEQALLSLQTRQVDCNHAALPPAGSVEPFGFRLCPTCGQRMRAYPASVTAGDPEWRVAL